MHFGKSSGWVGLTEAWPNSQLDFDGNGDLYLDWIQDLVIRIQNFYRTLFNITFSMDNQENEQCPCRRFEPSRVFSD